MDEIKVEKLKTIIISHIASNKEGGYWDFKEYHHTNKARWVCGGTTTQRYLVIAEFKHFCEFFNFTKNGSDFRNKEKMDSITVCIAIVNA